MQGFTTAGGPTDLAQLQSTMQAIELACSSIQMHINPATAEATILSLRQSPQPYKTCQFILENSLVANARFEAAAAIHEAAIREWGFLTSDDKRGLISFCICYVMQHASSPDGFVQSKVSSVAAQLMKRGWLDFTTAEKETFFYQVNQAIMGIHGLDMQFAGINFLESLMLVIVFPRLWCSGTGMASKNQCFGKRESWESLTSQKSSKEFPFPFPYHFLSCPATMA